MTAARRDLAERYLRHAVRLLPTARRDWGRAMIAELSTIDCRAARWRFAIGCTGAALQQRAPARLDWRPIWTVLTVVAVLAAEVGAAVLIGETVPLAATLAILVWRAGRPGLFGPARADRPTRFVRAGTYLVAALSVFLVAPHRPADLFTPGEKDPVSVVVFTFVVALLLSITASTATLGRTGLAAGATAGVGAGLAAFLVLPFDRVLPPLAHGLPGHGGWLAVVVFGAPVVAAAVTWLRTARADQAAIAALCAGTLAPLVASILSLVGIALFPGLIPDWVGEVMVAGTPEALRRAEDIRESSDPAAGLLAFGALLGAILWVVARAPLRRWKLLLVGPLSYLPIAFAASSDGFPGIHYIRVVTWILVLGTLAVTAWSAPTAATDLRAPAPVPPLVG